MNGRSAKSLDEASLKGDAISTAHGASSPVALSWSKLEDAQTSASSAVSLIDRFEDVCRIYPDHAAVAIGREQITYRDLNVAASQLAHSIIRKGIPKAFSNGDVIVAIYLHRSISMVVAMLAVLKAGCAYLPIDPTYPDARIAQTLEDASPVLIVTEGHLADGLHDFQDRALLIDELETASAGDDCNLPLRSSADDLAYVMYTSGSTGKPKGVLVTHVNVLRLFSQTDAWFHFDQNDVWTMFHSFAFDFSVWEIWGPLLTGGKLIIVPFATSRSTEDFYALLSSERVTVLNQTPSAFSLLDQVDQAGPVLPLALRLVIFGGEALQYRALRSWFKRHGEQTPQLINMYGITETTVHVTYRIVTEVDAYIETDSPIGMAIPDLQLYLLDADLRPVADGEEGELCIGGAGVARGYLNRPELTAQRFVPDPFLPGSLLYRSGDLARRRADGEVVYLGRNDSQVKINGFRIELGEVEAAVAAFPGIQQVCVIAHADHAGRRQLAAYFVAQTDAQIPARSISQFLSERSPAQMIPAFYVQIPILPLTHNGKVDRAALPTPATGSAIANSGLGSPMQERVAAVWRSVLEAPNVGIDDNFFDIGGSSILLIRVRAELQTQLGRQIPITWMFEFTTIRDFADKLCVIEFSNEAPEPSAVISAAKEQARKQREAFARMRSAKGGRS